MLAPIVKRYDAFTNPYHIRSQAHASIPMELKRIKQVVTNSVICDRSEIGRLRKKKKSFVIMGRIMTSDLSSNLVIQSDCKNGGLFGQNFLRNDVAQRHIDSEQRQINGTA